MNKFKIAMGGGLLLAGILFSSADYVLTDKTKSSVYQCDTTYEVAKIELPTFKSCKKPKNIIIMIGDGMGVSQVFAGMTANKGELYLNLFKCIGFSRTQSANKYVTDSAAGGTALSTGTRTNNGYIAVDTAGQPLKTILEIAEEKGMATGLIATSTITHATPASFIAHNISRGDQVGIATDFLKTDIDVFIGGGKNYFNQREDNRNLLDELTAKGYQIADGLEAISKVKSGKLAGFIADEVPGKAVSRNEALSISIKTGLDILDDSKDGFFAMIEGSQIDWGGHAQSVEYIAREMMDFDKSIGEVLKFAAENKETLIIVTADHETGGLAIVDGNLAEGEVAAMCPINYHTGVMVPVFAFGPGAENFMGIYNNTEIFEKMKALMK